MVVGDQQPFIACLVTLDPEAIGPWAAAHGKSGDVAALAEDPELLAEIQQGVDEANKAVSKAEAIRKFTVLPVDWTEEGGQLTPSLKLKRSVVMKEFAADVEALYAGGAKD
jgi:long-chain acyl-CoA synthetase